MRRTLNGLGAALAVAAWVLASVAYPALPSTIPTHFDAAGHPDRFGPKATVFIGAAIGTFVWAILCAAQRGNRFNYPFPIAPAAEARAQDLSRALLATIGALIPALMLALEGTMVGAAASHRWDPEILAVWACVALILAVVAAYLIVLWRTCSEHSFKQRRLP